MRYLILLLCLTACETPRSLGFGSGFSGFGGHREAAAAEHSARLERNDLEYSSKIIRPRCDGDDVEDITKMEHQENCGLITFFEYNSIAQFEKENCPPSKKPTKECLSKFIDMYFAKLELRYKYADWKEATLWCRANPKECTFSNSAGAANFEMQLATSHNKAVAAAANSERQLIQQQAEVDARERHRATMQMIQSTFQQNKQVNCTTTKMGNVYNSTCN
jgi:hypothetical protein